MRILPIIIIISALSACQSKETKPGIAPPTSATVKQDTSSMVKAVITTDTTAHDTDDPCIWVHPTDPSKSLIIGTDKDEDGALYVFDLHGKIVKEKCIHGLQRPNNVDLVYGFQFGDTTLDIIVTTERLTHSLRIFSVPDMKELSNGGIPVFLDQTKEGFRDLMGVAFFKDLKANQISVIVGRKNGPTDGTYLWQYELESVNGQLTLKKRRQFGQFSGLKEIEAIAVDHELGYVYYSDENFGIRKYYAHPDSTTQELAQFGKTGFTDDHEGISIYKLTDSTGYILVSDQQAQSFRVFPREGDIEDKHQHSFMKSVKVTALESDGSDVVSQALSSDFPGGLFVAMSEGKVFKYYAWKDIAGDSLKVRP